VRGQGRFTAALTLTPRMWPALSSGEPAPAGTWNLDAWVKPLPSRQVDVNGQLGHGPDFGDKESVAVNAEPLAVSRA
jgi:hypothetical protein